MFDAPAAPAETRQPDPDRAVPPRLGKVLGVVRAFIAYGQNLADTLRQHVADPRRLPCLVFIVLTFATTDLAAVLARVSRGLLRAAALEERLRRRAARGQELKVAPTRQPRSKPPAPKPTAPPRAPAQDPALAGTPTTEQILAQDRRRPIGAVLVEICRDLGISVGHMDGATSEELRLAVILYGGSLRELIFERDTWYASGDSAASWLGDIPVPIDSTGNLIIVSPPWPAPLEKPSPLAGESSREAERWGRGPGP